MQYVVADSAPFTVKLLVMMTLEVLKVKLFGEFMTLNEFEPKTILLVVLLVKSSMLLEAHNEKGPDSLL